MGRFDRKDPENFIADPDRRKHYREQLALAAELDADGLLDGCKPLDDVARGVGDPAPSRRTYVFQWFARDETAACESLVVHTAGSARALALFEQNAACGALVHSEEVSPRCEVLALDADDCRTCFGAGKLSMRGKQREACKTCGGTGKARRL